MRKLAQCGLGLLLIGVLAQPGHAASDRRYSQNPSRAPAPVVASESQSLDHPGVMQRVELGFQLPNLMGDAALKFSRNLGITGSLILNRNLIHPQLEPVAMLSYQPLSYLGSDGVKLNVFALTFGLRAMSPVKAWGGLVPYFGVHLGPIMNWVQTSGSGGSANTTIGGMVSIAPGFYYELSQRMTLNFSVPLNWMINRSSNFAYVAENLALQYHL